MVDRHPWVDKERRHARSGNCPNSQALISLFLLREGANGGEDSCLWTWSVHLRRMRATLSGSRCQALYNLNAGGAGVVTGQRANRDVVKDRRLIQRRVREGRRWHAGHRGHPTRARSELDNNWPGSCRIAAGRMEALWMRGLLKAAKRCLK